MDNSPLTDEQKTDLHKWCDSMDERTVALALAVPPASHVKTKDGHHHVVPAAGMMADVVGYMDAHGDDDDPLLIVLGQDGLIGGLTQSYVKLECIDVVWSPPEDNPTAGYMMSMLRDRLCKDDRAT